MKRYEQDGDLIQRERMDDYYSDILYTKSTLRWGQSGVK